MYNSIASNMGCNKTVVRMDIWLFPFTHSATAIYSVIQENIGGESEYV